MDTPVLPTAGDDPYTDWSSEAFAGRIRTLLGVDIASIATAGTDGYFHMAAHQGAATDAYRRLTISPGAGLGGLAARLARAIPIDDYETATMITADYRETVRAEGLRAMVCVPVTVSPERSLLLYAGNRRPRSVGDRTIGQLEGLAWTVGQQVAAASRARQAAQADRRRIATELHDSVAQVLFAIAVAADPTTDDGDPDIRLAHIAELAGAGRADLRRMLGELAIGRLRHVDDRPMETVLRRVGAEVSEQTGVAIDWIVGHIGQQPGPERLLLLADAVREGLRNAAKHARTDLVLASVAGRDPIELVLQMRTRHARVPTDFPRGSGLHLLALRANALGGLLTLHAHPDGDHSIVVQRLTLPLGTE